ncbi:MAG: hypothetical protein JSS82_10585 [Bacteroidetes bacterium]|nr:hypothetical protein [Bacteroidota bacterium]
MHRAYRNLYLSISCLLSLILNCIFPGAIAAQQVDTVVVAANAHYKRPFIIKQLFLGSNYRKEWRTPVKVPVFNLGNTQGGFTVIKEGGGKQTKSLQMHGREKDYVIRTINKNVYKALPPSLRNTPVKNIVQDLVSASYPYAPLVVSELARALGIVAPYSNLYYVQASAGIGEYQDDFTNQMVFLEESHPLPQGMKPESTEDVFKDLKKDDRGIVLQKHYLRVRLLDMLVADWDRHEDQWKWGKYDSAGRTYYYIIPFDRDQAFFKSNGLVVKAGSMFVPYVKGFRAKLGFLTDLTRLSRYIDRMFLNELEEQDWREALQEVHDKLSDSVIDAACLRLPPEIYAIRGRKIASILKRRRDALTDQGLEYYRYLAQNIYLTGSEAKEHVTIQCTADHTDVSIYSCKNADQCLIFHRRFYPHSTRHIYLVGYDDDDTIDIAGKENKPKIVKVPKEKEKDYNMLAIAMWRLKHKH